MIKEEDHSRLSTTTSSTTSTGQTRNLQGNNFEKHFYLFKIYTQTQMHQAVFLVKWDPGRGPELREPNKAVLCLLIISI